MATDDRDHRRHDDEFDDYDAPMPESPARPRKQGGDGFATVVPYRNGAALAAYYMGVFGLIPGVGFVLGPLALIFGIVGLVKARKNPKAHGTGHAIVGILLGLIDPVLWIVLWYTVFDKLTKAGV
jgi:uncharacterized protein YqgC (DUF456 family)